MGKFVFLHTGIEEKKRQARRKLHRDMEPEFFKIYDECAPFTMTSIERMYSLYKAVEYISKNKIAGDIVECGVWRGGSCLLIAKTLELFHDQGRALYLYDTFEGMPAPTKEDVARDGQRLTTQWNAMDKSSHNDWCYASLEDVKRTMSLVSLSKDRINYVVGKVEETIPGTIPGAIALLRLDTDWYESTKHEMTHLYPQLASKGVLLLDDYGHWKGARDAVDESFVEMGMFPYLARVDYTGRVFIKP